MRRLCTFALLFASLLAAAIPGEANASTGYQFMSRGSTANAVFSTLPSDGPRPNTIYTDSHVFTAHDATMTDGTRYRDDLASVSRFSYRFNDDGSFVPVAQAFGFVHGEGVSLAVSGGLTTATVNASVPITRCEFSGDGAQSCADATAAALNISWSSQGTVTRGLSINNWSSGASRYISRSNGSFRNATARGTLGSDDLGTSTWATLSDTSSMSLSTCHGC
jgi:hypothetical protein